MSRTQPKPTPTSNAIELPPGDSEALIARFLRDARFVNARAMHAAVEQAANAVRRG